MTKTIHGLRKDSTEYDLVVQAIDIALSGSVSEARQFLREQVSELGLGFGQCLLISNAFEKCTTNLATII